MAREQQHETETEDFTIDVFRPEDAEGIVHLFLSVYGEHYPIRLFYDPAAITKANAEGAYYSIVARTASGRVIGVNHLYLSAPHPGLYESGVGLVLKEYRNTGANKRMLDFIYNDFVLAKPHIEEVFGEAVCNHPYMQKSIKAFGYIETALEVALMPAATYDKEKSALGRVATLAAFRCYRSKPHRIFLPGCYEEALRRIYGRLDDARQIDLSDARISVEAATKAEMTLFDFAGVSRTAVHEIGVDLQAAIADLERRAQAGNARVFQVWLNLTSPWVGEAVEILRTMGYFFGGALPRWFDGDGLLMQKLLCPPDFDDIVLETDFAKELLEVIRDDWKRTNVA